METLIVAGTVALFTGAGLVLVLALVGRSAARDRAAEAVHRELARRVALHERLRERGIESPFLKRYRGYEATVRRELERRGIPTG